jgi:excisionase family DNA binding protein
VSVLSSEKWLLKPSEAAKILGIGRSKVYELINARRLPTVDLGPRCTRIPRAALEAWIAEESSRKLLQRTG